MSTFDQLGVKLAQRLSGRPVVAILSVALAPTALLLSAAFALFARRVAGALDVPPSLPVALAVAVVVGGLLILGRLVRAERPTAFDWNVPAGMQLFLIYERYLQFAAAAVVAAVLSLPGIAPSTRVFLWMPVALAAAIAVGERRRPVTLVVETASRQVAPATTIDEPALRPDVSLQLVRFVDAAGRDVIEATARVRFAVGQRHASVHLAFCPPFETKPEVACELSGELDGDAQPVQVSAFAARCDVKLTVPADRAAELLLACVASSPAAADSKKA
jgi:hypothetical protein